MDIVIWSLALVVSLFILVKSADWFTDNAEVVGLALGIPSFIIGVTLVSVGTSLPELATALVAAFHGQTEIVAANVVGSNLFNIALAVGLPALVAGGMAVRRDLINLDIPLLAAVTVLGVFVLSDGVVTPFEGLILLLGLGTYLAYTVNERKGTNGKGKSRPKITWKNIFFILVGIAGVVIGSKYTIDSVLALSEMFSVSPAILSLTAIALGTSLPEVVVALSAARKKQYEIALGGIVGSNVFNLTAVLGIPALFSTLYVDQQTLTLALPFMAGITLLYAFSSISRKVHVWEGAMFILVYVLFLSKLFFTF